MRRTKGFTNRDLVRGSKGRHVLDHCPGTTFAGKKMSQTPHAIHLNFSKKKKKIEMFHGETQPRLLLSIEVESFRNIYINIQKTKLDNNIRIVVLIDISNEK